MITQISPTNVTDSQTVSQNYSIRDGCIELRLNYLKKLEFIPWDNPNNIVSEEAERYTRKARVILLTILFFIGGPGNVINMAVFFKQGLRDRVNLLLFSLSFTDAVFMAGSFVLVAEELFLSLSKENNTGPVLMFAVNNGLTTLLGFSFVSFALSAIIACERCYCVLRPLKYQTLMRTRTMAGIILITSLVVLGVNQLISMKFYFVCVYYPVTGAQYYIAAARTFYLQNKDLIDYIDTAVYGIGLPGSVMMLVIVATIITAYKLHQIVAWRTETSSSLSAKEVALTKMLIGTSVLLIVCVSPTIFRVACVFLPELSVTGRNHNLYFMFGWISFMLLYVNFSFNIFIYYVMGSRYRETFWSLFGRKAGQKKTLEVAGLSHVKQSTVMSSTIPKSFQRE